MCIGLINGQSSVSRGDDLHAPWGYWRGTGINPAEAADCPVCERACLDNHRQVQAQGLVDLQGQHPA